MCFITILYVPVVTLSARDNEKLSKLHSKGFECSVFWNGYKRESDNKHKTKKKKDFFSNQTLSSQKTIYLFWTIQMKILLLEDSKLKGITYQK